MCKTTWLYLILALFLSNVACRPERSGVRLQEAWNAPNDPSLMGLRYEFSLDQLPLAGASQGPRWSGDYWPTYRGGIAQRWLEAYELSQSVAYALLTAEELASEDLSRLSPAEKYDLYAGDLSYSLTRMERQRTRALDTIPGTPSYRPGFTIPSWEGLCHGWAPATISYPEPDAVTLENPDGLKIPFYSADVKALLSFLMHEGRGSRQQFLGRRCEADMGQLQLDLASGRISAADYAAQVESLACRDTNAASFHIVLANELGLRQQAFVMDMSRGYQVWNQPVVAFASDIGQPIQQASPGASPDTFVEVEVETTVTYIREVDSEREAQGPEYSAMFAEEIYRYRLELNRQGEIVGGAWLSEDRPDFLWRQSLPLVSKRLRYLPQIYKAASGHDLPLPHGVF